MTLPILLAAAQSSSSGNMISQTAEQFGVNWWLFISQCISFCIVAFLLHKFAYRPILAQLEARRNKIAESLKNAEEIKVQLAAAQETAQAAIAKAGQDAQRIIDEARAAAKAVQELETQRAVMEAQQIIAKAKEATEVERNRMLAELKREVARLVLDTTAKVTGKVLTAEDQRRIGEETAREIAA